MFFKGQIYECEFCKRCNLPYKYDGSEMTNHPQSGDACCFHCSISILFDDCIFCDHYIRVKGIHAKHEGKCTLKHKFIKSHDTCDKWHGETYNIE